MPLSMTVDVKGLQVPAELNVRYNTATRGSGWSAHRIPSLCPPSRRRAGAAVARRAVAGGLEGGGGGAAGGRKAEGECELAIEGSMARANARWSSKTGS